VIVATEPRALTLHEQLQQVHRRINACDHRQKAALEDLQALHIELAAGHDIRAGMDRAMAEFRAAKVARLALVEQLQTLTRAAARAERFAGLVPGANPRPAADELRAP
jgi:hypothetical protein